MKYDVVCSVRNLEKMWYNEKGMPSQSIIADSFHSLKHAVAWMEKIDVRMLVPHLALNLPAYIQELAVVKHRNELLTTKLYMPEDIRQRLPGGIYLNINTAVISVKDIEKKSGLYLPVENNLHKDKRTFLSATTKELLRQEVATYKKHLFVRLIRPAGSNGITLN